MSSPARSIRRKPIGTRSPQPRLDGEISTDQVGTPPPGFKRHTPSADTEGDVTPRLLATALIPAVAVAAALGIPAAAQNDASPTATASAVATAAETTAPAATATPAPTEAPTQAPTQAPVDTG